MPRRDHYRVLDPENAPPPRHGRLRPTVYDPTRLLLRGLGGTQEDRRSQLRERLAERGIELPPQPAAGRRARDPDERPARRGGPRRERPPQQEEPDEPAEPSLAEALQDAPPAVRELAERLWVEPIRLPSGGRPEERPDAWEVLATLQREEPDLASQLSLDHLVRAAPEGRSGTGWRPHPYWGVHPYWGTHPYWGAHGDPSEHYGQPGFGGRVPVHWHGPDPAHRNGHETGAGRRSPVVAVADTGLGAHPWFTSGVQRDRTFHGLPIGGDDCDLDPASCLDRTGLLQGASGHGTFIAGLIRQTCPEATVMPVPVLHADGFVDEVQLHQALVLLLLRHVEGQLTDRPDQLIDVLSLSLGFYHETPEDTVASTALRDLMDAYGDAGVAVVAAAGNDCTDDPLLPAGFAGQQVGLQHARVPLVSVGALNPDGDSVAWFSNTGDWVSCFRVGAALVSTVPTTMRGGQQPAVRTIGADHTRATLDPDDYSCGFATWSGTSFAAPVVAGALAAHLAGRDDTAETGRDECATRGWEAVHAELEWTRP
ncbi:S8/S53 family peptidase [Ornithinicoccus halotolerans]|uniref:S8/S53 family peptidase n=1 Tax=Ornithinicoccus halotolerans TaxID=1748220 RepID=UPI001294C047|nr:S8/S53 family peptidase [Ornithinicoccus halotolerans]